MGATVDQIAAPGVVFALARHDGAAWAMVQTSPVTRPVWVELMRLDGDRLVGTGLGGAAVDAALVDGPRGPWLVIGATAREIGGDGIRDVRRAVGAEPLVRMAITADATIVASVGAEAGEEIGRVRAFDLAGALTWTTDLPPGEVAFAGVIEIRRDHGWKPEPKPAWRPRRWEPYRSRPIATGGLIVASFYEPDSGIGVWYGLATEDGRVLWATPPGPMGSANVLAPDEVAIGSQGYGAFASELRDRSGDAIARWPSHGTGVVIDGALVVAELDNGGRDRRHLVRWHRDGRIDHGARLAGYYTTRPAACAGHQVVFARGEALWAGDRALAVTSIAALPGGDAWMGRTVVLPDGTVVVADLAPRIWRIRETGLAPTLGD